MIFADKQCVFILPYFGKFNNYFPLFLRSCGYNPSFDFFIFTDNTVEYDYPSNVHVISMTLDEFKTIAKSKLGFPPCIPSPYKLCDFKPAYGIIFEDYISDYKFWGHCDCDLVFGNLEKILSPILLQNYEKIFSAGHLTVYRNEYANNRRFMKALNGRRLYIEAFTTDRIYVFDEDNPDPEKNPDRCNVHSIFLNDHVPIYLEDVSMNISMLHDHIRRSYYVPETRTFVRDPYTPSRLYWMEGSILLVQWHGGTRKLSTSEYLYAHFHSRKMRISDSVLRADVIEIRPDRFVAIDHIPNTRFDMHLLSLRLPSLFWLDVFSKRVKKKFLKLFTRP
ncbi:DUF6625 family protein [Bifidobacterium vespertilionis]|uniref:Uncharacterized protein n=1 Tax=Bifidobacterium vespertilionis TaxID=2562524 RepID=A0A5J5DVQ4_9BIFI|nr:DUF6625 family protein [Bifidobacterium vespertilionis]KAA8820752.1 hypothetical protein EMO90_06105 [Bifidobacterium vespertilionis]KAA8821801.1 hypothetical protein EM848_10075 [Bifidobacterium vespertilionis]